MNNAGQGEQAREAAQEGQHGGNQEQGRGRGQARGRGGARGRGNAGNAPPAVQVPAGEFNVDIIRAALNNGPITTGVAQGADKVDWNSLKMPDMSPQSVTDFMVRILKVKNIHEPVWNIIYAAFALLRVYPILAERNDLVAEGHDYIMTDEDSAIAQDVYEKFAGKWFSSKDVANVLTIIVATKIAFWQTNHHVGIGTLVTIVRKVLESMDGDYQWNKALSAPGTAEAVVHPIWVISHLFNTKGILSVMGIAGLNTLPAAIEELKAIIAPARDILMRANSCPAGTAKVFDIALGIEMIGSHHARRLIAVTKEMKDVISLRNAIRKAPVEYHVGSQFLCGKQAKVPMSISQETINTVFTFISTVTRGSSLLRASVFIGATPDSVLKGAISGLVIAHKDAIHDAIDASYIKDDMGKNVTQWETFSTA